MRLPFPLPIQYFYKVKNPVLFRTVALIAALAYVLSNAYAAHAQLEYYTYNGVVTIIAGCPSNPAERALVIPATIEGLPVTSIGYEAFRSCTSLTNITIPNSVTSIEEGAFYTCTGLAAIRIPGSVTNIGDRAFDLCWSLSAIEVDPANPAYSSEDGVLFDKSQTVLLKCPEPRRGTYTIPDGVISIGNAALGACVNLTAISIPSSVTSIGDLAFWACTNLASIAIPNSVTHMGDYAFYECRSLTNITISTRLTRIGDRTFQFCDSLPAVTMPNSVTNIGDAAFSQCISLSRITIPDSVTRIGDLLFSSCTSLTNITIPESVTSIGDGAFTLCTSLTRVTIPKSVTSLGGGAFYLCSNLDAAYFQGSAPSIGFGAFASDNHVTLYHLAGTAGWNTISPPPPNLTPWVLPYPVILSTGPDFGIRDQALGFRVSWATNASVVIERSATLTNLVWIPIATNTIAKGADPLTDGWSDFRDPVPANASHRFYRVRSP